MGTIHGMRKPFAIGYLLAALLFGWALLSGNFEFLIYAVTTIILVVLLHAGDRHFGFNTAVLWGFDLWILLHILGGLLPVDGGVLYSLVLVDIVGEPYSILKYDQLVHVYCYFVATLLLWQIIAAFRPQGSFHALAIITVLAAGGVGALNELIEFTTTVLVPDTNVGGYENTALDIVANFAGAMLAVAWFRRLNH